MTAPMSRPMSRPMPRPCTRPPTGAPAARAATLRAHVPALEGPRLRLRAPRLGDFDAYARLLAEDTGHMGGPFAPDAAWADFCNYIAGWMLQGTGLWAIDHRDGHLVGFITLGLEWDDEEPELGWMLLPEHRGQGYAQEAAGLAARWGCNRLPGLVSYIAPGNTASQRLAARLGARRDADAEARIATWEPDPVQVWRHAPRPEGQP